ncbi:unnamed protein product, partial [Amoebophrya sp. A120]
LGEAGGPTTGQKMKRVVEQQVDSFSTTRYTPQEHNSTTSRKNNAQHTSTAPDNYTMPPMLERELDRQQELLRQQRVREMNEQQNQLRQKQAA